MNKSECLTCHASLGTVNTHYIIQMSELQMHRRLVVVEEDGNIDYEND